MLKLLWIALKVKWQECREFACVVWRFRSHKAFLLSYCLLAFLYLFSSPYSVSRRYLKWIDAGDVYSYGETPLTSLAEIADRTGIHASDHVFELGAGSGFTSLWLRLVKGCKITAVEWVPGFVYRLKWVVRVLKLSGVEVRCEDYLQTALENATVIYLFASNLDDLTINKLAERLAALPSGTRIASVSYPLQPYLKQPAFDLVERFEVCFPWGRADVYVQDVV
ncbi:SAM-dependent methyltransferase [Endozoicomonas euniceicola]|uniref:Class I SAM-dependent methyltransferase n=1 Tax=Endozoicomonas euniceicola TaxID=1234143 RepID=A0ABY6GR71_9GAMM|nr:class I SAM-dependent methyltransferase [Endozoicomonas euniceicola]UYM14551.1 class I SAM-dependent methyltransferase [Endozoicomonas euniceicola]